MKWEPQDIRTGLELVSTGLHRYTVGYLSDDPNIFVLINLSDGAVGDRLTKEQLVDELNRHGYKPRYEYVFHD